MPWNMNKPYKGRVEVYRVVFIPQKLLTNDEIKNTLGYVYAVKFLDHIDFMGKTGSTSLVVKDDCNKPRHRDDSYFFETLNSRYTAVKPSSKF